MIQTSRIAYRVTLALGPALLVLAACAKKETDDGEGKGDAKAVVTAKTAVASVEPVRR